MSKFKFISTGQLSPALKKKRELRKCYRCKTTTEKLIFSNNPYESEINNDYSKHYFCQSCLSALADEI